ncbi:transposase mutator type (plasmid) [Thermovirga lienii DSM 17291]|uniref:Mutator family transposase n=2 Tax=Bacteria TaxID=2 RepID=K4LY64_THEPS|nr:MULTISPECIES: IS256 family transposase [Bacteria]AER65755.1 transposase mutator type [Thermovirga lienii DSM 17291]AER65975.1 transposase mutator type [Thermovirga lienii DSM 17291]AER65983.1 transposase mutator type [Thermovirga lienii DSM 17291]AER66945.1 transposase mutator type [Thermovirga lienii DSM 17291]AER66952.1 transposase mutator type [Thermovirga lienii DSM 17291]
MAHYQVTVDCDLLQGLFIRDDGLARLVENIVNQILDAQATEQLRAKPYERTEERQGYRNGYRDKLLKSRVGELTLMVPRLRSGHFSTELFERYQRSEQALLLAMVEMVVNGVSTRKVRAVVDELCGTEFSKSTVSSLCKRLDDIVKEWNERDLSSQEYPFLLVDAIVIRVRKGGRVRLSSVLLATGINREGYREILGLMLGDSESEAAWSEFFGRLKERGLKGVDLVVSDDHKGLINAIETHFQGATWQRCQTHFIRNILDACPKSLQGDLHGRLRLIFDAPDMETARRLLNETIEAFGARAPKAVERLEAGFEDAMAVMALPGRYRKRLRTTNGVERLNQEIRRRERVIRIFPNEESAVRLIGAVLVEIDEVWTTGKRYFDMAEYWEWKANTEKQQKEVNNADTQVNVA